MLLLSVGIPGLREEGNGIVRCQHAWPEAALNDEEAFSYS